MKKKIAALVMALAVAMSPMTAAAEWKQDSYQNWQWVENGTPVTGWKFIGQNWYYFGGNGKMVTGWQNIEGKWYYFNRNGAMQTGWSKVDGKWYYLNGSGEMATGWKKVAGYWYYMNSQGVMQTGWLSYGPDKYYLDQNGAMEIGWVEVGKDWYFMNHDGLLQTGAIEVNGEVYYLGKDGKMVTGKTTISGKQFEFAKTGESVGKLTPKPGKAFDAFGYPTAITVEGGSSGSTATSGGSTIIYVPVDNGGNGGSGNNNGNNGGSSGGGSGSGSGSTDPGDNTGGSSGGETGGNVNDAEKLSALDNFIAAAVPQINEEHGREFTVSFDKNTHTVTVAIKNLEKRITNIRYYDWLYELVDYEQGLVTDYRIGNGQYRALYETRENIEGSIYRYPISLSRNTNDFLDAGLSVFSTMETLIGKSAQVNLRMGTLETKPYTVNFVQAAEIVSDSPVCKMTVGTNTGSSLGYADCLQTEAGVRVVYTLPYGYEYDAIWFEGSYERTVNDFVWLGGTAPYEHYSPSLTITQQSDGIYTTTATRDGKTYSYNVRYEEDGFTLLGMDLSNYYYRQYAYVDDPAHDVIGNITVRQISEPGVTLKVNGESRDIEITENGLRTGKLEGNLIWNLRVELSSPILLNGLSVDQIYINNLFGSKPSGYALSSTPMSTWYYLKSSYKSDASTYVFEFENGIKFSMFLIDGNCGFLMKDLTSDAVQGIKTAVTFTSRKPVVCYRNNSEVEYQVTDENGLTISTNGYGSFQNEFSVDFYVPVQIDDKMIRSVEVNTYTDENGQPLSRVYGEGFNFYSEDGQLTQTVDEATGITTYRFANLTDSFTFRVKFSEDGKSISFPDITEAMLDQNSITVYTYVE